MSTETPATAVAAARRTLSFSSLQDILDDAERITAGGQVITSGTWSAAEIIDHVRILMNIARTGFDFTMPLPLRIMGRLLRTTALTKPIRPGFKFPKIAADTLMPDPNLTLEESKDRLREEIRLSSQPGAMRHPSPLLGKLTHEQWVQLNCRHAELHFSFMHRADDAHATSETTAVMVT